MDGQHQLQAVELRLSYGYASRHPWTVQAITGFLSAYFMERPGFSVQQHVVELESGMHVWICHIPADMKVMSLVKRLKEDLPPCHVKQMDGVPPARPQYVIESPEAEPAQP